MQQYLDLCNRILEEGTWVTNKRTGVRCLTVINADLVYSVEDNQFPLLTTKKTAWKAAIAELLGYLKGYDNASDFRALGCKTWDANANDNLAWLANPNRKGTDDMGRVYGVQGRSWNKPDGTTHDQLQKLVDNLTAGIDDRGEILTFYNPGEFELGCLRPCLHTHQFSLLDGKLYLNSFQRSTDLPLGAAFNMVQCYVLLALVAQITGHRAGKAYHKMVNVHIYENQIEPLKEQLKRQAYPSPKLYINPDIRTLEDITDWVTTDDFTVVGYEHHPAIKFPFTV